MEVAYEPCRIQRDGVGKVQKLHNVDPTFSA
jgi:hypothetical protein